MWSAGSRCKDILLGRRTEGMISETSIVYDILSWKLNETIYSFSQKWMYFLFPV